MIPTLDDVPKAEGIRFHSRCLPSLAAGDYTLRAAQSVSALGRSDDVASDIRRDPFGIAGNKGFEFSVAGPRFALDPTDVYSVHPPKGQSGNFAETLPHIVFSRRTLPWEREVKGHKTAPWLGLLVLGPSDFKSGTPDVVRRRGSIFPPVVTRRVGELLSPVEPGVLAPLMGEGKAEDWLSASESFDDLCSTLDLPATVFQNVAPRLADLELLTHVREVDTGAKETSSLISDGWFSVAVGNRLPEPAQQGETAVENRVFLVSFEGLTQYLDPEAEYPEDAFVRMAVLAQWSFGCESASGVAAAMVNLTPSLLTIPAPDSTAGDQDQDQDYVRRAFAMGFTALNHSTRWGDKTVSWYRGPLASVRHVRESDMEFRPAADAALRYSPRDGMFDVSYAAAYQLGRLLAMQDRHFAASIQEFRRQVRAQVNEVFGRERARQMSGANLEGDSVRDVFASYLGDLIAEPGKESFRGDTRTKTDWSEPEPLKLAETTADTGPGVLPLSSAFDLRIPAAVTRWLSRLLLLYRVPFVYLVPDERMLQTGTLAFFSLDPNWMKCLLEGACSVGRSSDRDVLAERELRNKFLDFALERACDIRAQKLVPGKPDPAKDRNTSETAKPPDWPLTGFIMRSPLVGAWQGVEMRAWKKDLNGKDVPLEALRIDRLSPEIMLCLFDGEVSRIEIKQPPEGLHFGLTFDPENAEAPFSKKTLRRLDAEGTHPAGTQIKDAPAVDVPLRDAPRVIDVVDLAGLLAEHCGVDDLTSAGFGVQMIDGPKRLEIKRE